ncbi:MAG: hypothetical protein AAF934_09915 [Bacteroidota bacterium]
MKEGKTTPIFKIKLSFILIVLGAVFACTAPFLHIFYPKTNPDIEQLKTKVRNNEISRAEYYIQKKPYTFFGYNTKMKFWYAIGKPIALLYFSLMLLYISSTYVVLDDLKRILGIITFIGISISFYFIVWVFWFRGDFPVLAYYISIGIIAVLSAYASYLLIVFRNSLVHKIRLLTAFIVGKGSTYVPQKDKKAYVRDYMETFKKLVE